MDGVIKRTDLTSKQKSNIENVFVNREAIANMDSITPGESVKYSDKAIDAKIEATEQKLEDQPIVPKEAEQKLGDQPEEALGPEGEQTKKRVEAGQRKVDAIKDIERKKKLKSDEEKLSETAKKVLEEDPAAKDKERVRQDIERKREEYTVRSIDDELVLDRVYDQDIDPQVEEIKKSANKLKEDPENQAFVKKSYYLRERILDRIDKLKAIEPNPVVQSEIAKLEKQEVDIFKASRVMSTSERGFAS